MKFTFEKEQKYFNFPDVKIIRENIVFTTSVYRKPTFSGVYTHFDSYMLLNYKFNPVSTFFTVLPSGVTCLYSIKKFVKLTTFL